MLRYTEEHEWLKQDGDEVIVGITEHAAEQLGDLVFVELPEEGTTVVKGDGVVTIESVKAASDISAPLDGQITEVNPAIVENPGPRQRGPDGGRLVLQDDAGRSLGARGADGRGRRARFLEFAQVAMAERGGPVSDELRETPLHALHVASGRGWCPSPATRCRCSIPRGS